MKNNQAGLLTKLSEGVAWVRSIIWSRLRIAGRSEQDKNLFGFGSPTFMIFDYDSWELQSEWRILIFGGRKEGQQPNSSDRKEQLPREFRVT